MMNALLNNELLFTSITEFNISKHNLIKTYVTDIAHSKEQKEKSTKKNIFSTT